ncbi:MAG: hypothetical protein J5643_02555 [Lachnospiraceae bacterium]|nr:hypothetical protein [Lachnospiraceae bacterium]
MRVYDENGRYIGSIRKKELIDTEEAIMPVAIKVTPPKEIALPDGFLIMSIGSLVAFVSLLLTLLSEWVGLPDGVVEYLEFYGVYGTRAVAMVPLAAFIHLVAAVLLMQRNKSYVGFAAIHVFVVSMNITVLIDNDWDHPNGLLGYAAFMEVFALIVLGCILYRDYSIKFYFGLVSVKTVLYAVFSFGTANLMNDGWRNMLFYYLIEAFVWLYIFFRVRRREQK